MGSSIVWGSELKNNTGFVSEIEIEIQMWLLCSFVTALAVKFEFVWIRKHETRLMWIYRVFCFWHVCSGWGSGNRQNSKLHADVEGREGTHPWPCHGPFIYFEIQISKRRRCYLLGLCSVSFGQKLLYGCFRLLTDTRPHSTDYSFDWTTPFN